MRLDAFGLTHAGKVRPRNEDQFLVAELTKTLLVRDTSIASTAGAAIEARSAHLLAVADGLGGAPAGAAASALAIDGAARHILDGMPWFHGPPNGDADVLADLAESVRRAQARLRTHVDAHPEHTGMATTLTMALVVWPKLYLVHVGDSRAYLWRGDRLEVLTRDHSLAEALAGDHPAARRVLWNVVTAEVDPKPDIRALRLEPDDLVLLCSDGLTNHLTDVAIASRLRAAATSEGAVRSLVEAVLARGGRDNATVVVGRVIRRHLTAEGHGLLQNASDLEDTHIEGRAT